MKLKILSLLILLLVSLSWQGCKKKGCTDPKSTNYNPEAEEDDGSCIYPPGANANMWFKNPCNDSVNVIYSEEVTEECYLKTSLNSSVLQSKMTIIAHVDGKMDEVFDDESLSIIDVVDSAGEYLYTFKTRHVAVPPYPAKMTLEFHFGTRDGRSTQPFDEITCTRVYQRSPHSNGIHRFQDIRLDGRNPIGKQFYSFTKPRIIPKDSGTAVCSDIELLFNNLSDYGAHFFSPKDKDAIHEYPSLEDWPIQRNTLFKKNQISPSTFNSIVDNKILVDSSAIGVNKTVIRDIIVGDMILFKLENGKRGIIHVTSQLYQTNSGFIKFSYLIEK